METAQGSHGVMLCADLGGTGQATQASIEQVREFLLEFLLGCLLVPLPNISDAVVIDAQDPA